MTEIIFLIFLTLLGAGMGSFVAASVSRAVKKQKQKEHFSLCDTCGRRLDWFELLPIFSYILQLGRCRHCGAKIPLEDFILELIGGATFLVPAWAFWEQGDFSLFAVVQFLLILTIFSLLLFGSLFDFKTLKFPNKIFLPALILAGIYFLLSLFKNGDFLSVGQSVTLALLPISGIYTVFYLISRGRLVGMADIKFGLIAAFLLPDWRATTLILFIANVIALIYYPLLKKQRKQQKVVAMLPVLSLACLLIYFCKSINLF